MRFAKGKKRADVHFMTNALEITDLQKTYASGVQALKGINLTVAQGDFFALLGPNGAGKTTLIGIIVSLVNKTSGAVSVFDYDLDSQVQAVKSCIGLVPQEFNLSIFEKVEDVLIHAAGYHGIPKQAAKVRAEKCLKQLEIWDKRDAQVRELSGGMKRRLMIARAIVHEPRLLILDEPTAGVDIEIRRSMWRFFKEINEQGVTIILTTHYLEEAESLCRNIAIIDYGKIIANTSVQEILRSLTQETFVLMLETPVSELPNVGGFNLRAQDKFTLEVDVAGDQTMNVLFEALSGVGIHVASMRNKINRLEELFLRLTGKEDE